MLPFPALRFVDAPNHDAAVRLDFHAGDCWTTNTEFEITPGDFLGDLGGIGGEDGFSRISFTWYIKAEKRVDALAQLSVLAQELRRDSNYLLFQPLASDRPLWYRCHRSTVGALSLRLTKPNDAARDVWTVAVNLVADYAALGPQESISLTIGNDPATGGLRAVLPAIKGDVPAPVVLDIGALPKPYLPLVSVVAFDIDAPALEFWQAERWRLPAGVATTALDASCSGGSKVSVVLTEEPTTVLWGNVTTHTAGRFLVLGRMTHTSGGFGDVTIKGAGEALVRSKRTRMTGGPTQLVELGEYAFPRGNMPVARPYVLARTTHAVEVKAWGTGDTGLEIDYLVAVPVDGIDVVQARLLSFESPDVGSQLGTRRINGEAGVYEQLTPSGKHAPNDPVEFVGGFPEVVPGASNVLYFFQRKRSDGLENEDAIADSATMTLTYRPRYVYLAGS